MTSAQTDANTTVTIFLMATEALRANDKNSTSCVRDREKEEMLFCGGSPVRRLRIFASTVLGVSFQNAPHSDMVFDARHTSLNSGDA